MNTCDAQKRPLSAHQLSLNNTRLYPIPARDEAFVDINAIAAESINLQVIDVLGRDVTERCTERSHLLSQGSNTLRLTTSNLAAGTYLFKLILGTAQETRKFTVIR